MRVARRSMLRFSAVHALQRCLGTSPTRAYDKLVASETLKEDPEQRRALRTLDRIWSEHESQFANPQHVGHHRRAVGKPSASRSWLSGLFGGHGANPTAAAANDAKYNAYLHGTVGTGKSFLMDLFYECISDPRKKRVHFNAFMLDVHRKIHHWRHNERKSTDEDPISPVAQKISNEASLLCFDEFQVTDVADAMILKRLFELMLANGVRVVATSNRPPSELYKGGLNRPLFEPFIDMLYQRFEVVDLTSNHDYRLIGAAGPMKVYLLEAPENSADTVFELRAEFRRLSHNERPVMNYPLRIPGLDRNVMVPECARGVAWFTFDALCRTPMAAADYLAIAGAFHTVFVSGIPKLRIAENAVARRFILFVDSLYEHRVKLIVSAHGAPEELFPQESDGAAQEEVFAFRRTASRLAEMGSARYLSSSHRQHQHQQ